MTDQPDDSGPRIEVRAGGPYLVKGGVPLRRTAAVHSEHGEPLTWRTTERLDAAAVVALCRCGGSARKPFCDGTHAHNGFDGTEAAPIDRYDERAKTYEGPGLVVRDDRGICEHAGFCGNRVTNVWKLVRSSATEDSVVRAQVMAMIERCPSGALTYRLAGEDDDIEPEVPVAIGVVADGPLFVTGGVPVRRADGQPFERRNRVTLCRCGGSSIKPLCDGTHRSNGFQDPGA
jgi:CDGSH-type Zn-finger protein